MENLKSGGILEFRFLGLEGYETEVWDMENHGNAITFMRLNRQKRSKYEKQQTNQKISSFQ